MSTVSINYLPPGDIIATSDWDFHQPAKWMTQVAERLLVLHRRYDRTVSVCIESVTLPTSCQPVHHGIHTFTAFVYGDDEDGAREAHNNAMQVFASSRKSRGW